MAVIHISEEEAARDLRNLIDKVRAGERVEIASGAETFALVPARPTHPMIWTTEDAVRQAEARNSPVTLDEDFGGDMEEIMRFNRLERPDPWESS